MAWLRRNVLIPLDEWRTGELRLKLVPNARRVVGSSDDAIRDHALGQLRAILKDAALNVPLYQARFRNAGLDPDGFDKLDDLHAYPLLQKSDIRDRASELLNRTFRVEELFASATGGTTDSPVKFYLDRESCGHRGAATVVFSEWFGYRLGDRIVLLWGAEQDYRKSLSVKGRIRRELLDPALYLPTSYLDEAVLRRYFEAIRAYRPPVIQAYPTPLYLLAEYMLQNELKLNVPTINTTAERLLPFQRAAVERAFNAEVFEWYGARDLGHIATECRQHDGMHVNAYGLYVETLKDGRPVLDEPGDIVVTDLFNRAMPLIRYRTGDVGVLTAHRCACGSALPVLKEVIGREADVFKLRGGARVPGVALTNRLVTSCNWLRQLQIVQKEFDLFELNVVPGKEFQEGYLGQLTDDLCQFLHERVSVRFNVVSEIPREPSGKTRFCKSEVS